MRRPEKTPVFFNLNLSGSGNLPFPGGVSILGKRKKGEKMTDIFNRHCRPVFQKMSTVCLAIFVFALLNIVPVGAISSIYEIVTPAYELDYVRLDKEGYLTELNQQVTLESEVSKTPVTMSIDWAYADENRISFGYRINGLPVAPSAARIMGSAELLDKDGMSFAHMGFSEAAWNPENNAEIVGFWHTMVQPQISKLGEPPFTLNITLDGRKTTTSDGPIPFAVFVNEPLAGTDASAPLLEETVGPFVFELDLPVYPLEKHMLDLVSEGGDVSLRLVQAETTPAETILSFCYIKPGPGDWMLSGFGGQGVNLKMGSEQFPFTQYQLLHDPEFKMKGAEIPFVAGADERCVALRFGLGKLVSPQHYEVQIDEMMLSLPEMIPQDQIETANERLADEGISVVYEHFSDPAGGGGGGGWKFTQKPDEMTEEEALRKVLEAMAYFHKGPWQFSFDLP